MRDVVRCTLYVARSCVCAASFMSHRVRYADEAGTSAACPAGPAGRPPPRDNNVAKVMMMVKKVIIIHADDDDA